MRHHQLRAAFLLLLASEGAFAAVGPASTLYVTAGDQQKFFLIQGSTVSQNAEVHGEEYALAVGTTVRTLGAYNFLNGGLGNEYSTTGTSMTATYTNSFGSQMLDGTT